MYITEFLIILHTLVVLLTAIVPHLAL